MISSWKRGLLEEEEVVALLYTTCILGGCRGHGVGLDGGNAIYRILDRKGAKDIVRKHAGSKNVGT
jgi:ribosomal protein S5